MMKTFALKKIYRFGRCFGLTGGVSFVACSDVPPDDATRDIDHEDDCLGVHPKYMAEPLSFSIPVVKSTREPWTEGGAEPFQFPFCIFNLCNSSKKFFSYLYMNIGQLGYFLV